MPSAMTWSRVASSGSGWLMTNPPFAPVGTMTVFLTICALTRPRISVRRSSRRSDQRVLAGRAAGRAVGGEAGLEQRDEAGDHAGMGRERLLHVALPERQAGLA